MIVVISCDLGEWIQRCEICNKSWTIKKYCNNCLKKIGKEIISMEPGDRISVEEHIENKLLVNTLTEED